MIKVLTGPMWSSKTKKLIKLARKAVKRKKAVLVLKPVRDIRDPRDTKEGDPHLRSFSGTTWPCRMVTDDELEYYIKYALYTKMLLIVDEGQFFGNGLILLAKAYLRSKATLWIAGLDLTSEGKPFGPMGKIINIAHKVIYRRAKCCTKDCPFPALFTHHSGKKVGDVKVGYAGYSVHCTWHWKEMMRK